MLTSLPLPPPTLTLSPLNVAGNDIIRHIIIMAYFTAFADVQTSTYEISRANVYMHVQTFAALKPAVFLRDKECPSCLIVSEQNTSDRLPLVISRSRSMYSTVKSSPRRSISSHSASSILEGAIIKTSQHALPVDGASGGCLDQRSFQIAVRQHDARSKHYRTGNAFPRSITRQKRRRYMCNERIDTSTTSANRRDQLYGSKSFASFCGTF